MLITFWLVDCEETHVSSDGPEGLTNMLNRLNMPFLSKGCWVFLRNTARYCHIDMNKCHD